MSIDTMRWVDKWIGIPLCFILDVFLNIKNLLISKPKVHRLPQKTLFIELSEMGSAILVDPALRFAQNQGQEIFFLIFSQNAQSLNILNTVKKENIWTIRPQSLWTLTFDTLKILFWCRKFKIDTVIDLELFSRFTSLITGLSGASKKIGFYKFHNEGLYRGHFLTHNVAYNPHLHISKSFLALVKSSLQKEGQDLFLKESISDSEIKLAKAQVSKTSMDRVLDVLDLHKVNPQLHKIILFNCAGGEFLLERRWPKSHYVQLANKILSENTSCYILLTGAPSEKSELSKIVSQVKHPQCINFAGEIGFEDLTALYQISTLMVTNDSGPAHFASTTNLPLYVIFGPETHHLYGALGNFYPIYAGLSCSPCVTAWNHRKTACQNNVCVQVIDPLSVYEKIKTHIQ